MKVAVYFGIADSDKSGLVHRKNFFQKIALIGIVSEHAGKIFADNAVNRSCFYIVEHSLKTGAVVIGSGNAVVYVIINKSKIS